MLDIIANIMIVKGCFALHFPIFKKITNSQSLCGSPDSKANSMFQLPQFSSKVIETSYKYSCAYSFSELYNPPGSKAPANVWVILL